MAKFLFIYRDSTDSTGSRAQRSPEEMQALQAAWGKWMQKFGPSIAGGDGLKPSRRLVKAGAIVTDGPYAEAKEVIASFSIIQADNLDAAVAIARECPGDFTIEVREMAGYA